MPFFNKKKFIKMNINQVINQNEFAVKSLLRRYRVIGDPSMETIQRAHELHGPEFMTKLLGIVTPDTASFTGIGVAVTPGSFVDTAAQYAKTQQKPKFWSFWDNLLNRVDATGQTIGNFKTNAGTQPQSVQYMQQQQQQKTVYIIAAVLIVAIVAILIFKKK